MYPTATLRLRGLCLRNDAAHDVYEKAPDGPRWRMRLEGRRPVPLDEFATGYVRELAELEALIGRAQELAAAVGPVVR